MTTFDQAQTPDNILQLIQDLQRRVAELETANVQASRLDEIAQFGGTLDYLASGQSTIDQNGIHTAANLVDIDWWLPLTLSGDNLTNVYTTKLVTISGVKYLYVGGDFQKIGGITSPYLARYNFSTRAWEAVASGLTTEVGNIAFDSAKNIYVTNASHDSIYKLVSGTWTLVGSALTSGGVMAMAFDASDVLYIGGSFLAAGGDALANRIAKLSAGNWVNVGGGVNDWVYAIGFDANNVLHIGGYFTDAGYPRIAKLVGGAWTSVGATLSNGGVNALGFDANNILYIGGTFTTDALRIARLVNGAWEDLSVNGLGSGNSNTVRAIAFDSENTLYIGRDGIDVISITIIDPCLKYKDGYWQALSNAGAVSPDIAGVVYDLAIDSSGSVYVGGNFQTVGTIQSLCVAAYVKPLSEAIDMLGSEFEQYKALYDTLYADLNGSTSNVFNVKAAAALTNAVRADQIQSQGLTAYTTGGTSTAYTLTTLAAPLALTTNERWAVKFHVTCGANPTLNRDGKGAKNLKRYDATGAKVAVNATIIIADMVYDVYYDGTDYVILSPLIQGTNTPAQIDAHIASVANPHSTTAAQVGALAVDARGMVAIGQKQVNVNNNAVYSFAPPSVGGFLLVSVYTTAGNSSWGLYTYRTTATSHMLAMVAGTNIDATTGALTGSTGVSGHATVSCHSDGNIYIENRLGAAKAFNIAVL